MAAGGTTLTSDNLGWMSAPAGQVVRFSALGDLLQSIIPDSAVMSSPGQPLSIEVRIYPRAYLGYSVDSVPIAALYQEYDTGYALVDQKWGSAPKGPVVGANGSDFVTAAAWAAAAPVDQWSLLRITYDGNSLVECHVNDTLVGAVYDEPNASRTNDWNLLLGNFDGDIDELRISSVVRTGEPPVDTVRPEVVLTAPTDATESFEVTAIFSESVTGFDAGDVAVTNGSVESVSGSDAVYTISVAPGTTGAVDISIVEGAATDAASNPSFASNTVSVLYAAPAGADPYEVDGDTTALYHFDDNYNDASGNGYHLSASGSVSLSADNTAWMASPLGKVVRFSALGDSLSVTIPDSAIMPSSGKELSLEARIYPRQYLGYSYGNVPIVSLNQNWNSSFEIRDSKWGSPHAPSVSSSNVELVSNQVWADNVTLNQWHHIQILFDGTDQVQFYLDGSLLGSAARQPHFRRNNAWKLELGHFDGDLDELRISSVVREVSDPPAPGGGGSDVVKPSVAISAVVQQQVNAPFPVSVNFSEAVSGLSESKFQIHNGSLAGLSGSGASYNLTVSPSATGVVSISLPGGRVSDGAGNGNVPSNLLEVEYTDPLATAVDAEKVSDSATTALYPMNGNGDDVSGNGFHLSASGGVSFASDNLGWMANAAGSVARFNGLGDTFTVSLPDSVILPAGGQPTSIEAWIYPRNYVGFSFDNVPIIALTQEWDSSLSINDRKWGSDPYGPEIVAGTLIFVDAQTWAALAPPNAWHRVVLTYDGRQTVECLIDGVLAGNAVVYPNDGRTGDWQFTLGNFDGDIDDVRISSVDRGIAYGARPSGLTADYFAGAEFDELRFTRIDPQVTFDWPSSPDARLGSGDFSVRWRGCITPIANGPHMFYVTTTEGSRLWLDGVLVGDSWGVGGTATAIASLLAGVPVTVVLEMASTSLPAGAVFEWEAAGLTREIIPEAQLLINESGSDPYIAIGYPTTWGDWVESARNPDKDTTPDSNRDNDLYTDLMEYALGESPSTSANGSPGFRIERSPGNMEAIYERPFALEDVRYVLEGSNDMRDWFTIGGDELARVSRNHKGIETVRFSEVDLLRSADGESAQFLRIRVDFIDAR